MTMNTGLPPLVAILTLSSPALAATVVHDKCFVDVYSNPRAVQFLDLSKAMSGYFDLNYVEPNKLPYSVTVSGNCAPLSITFHDGPDKEKTAK